MSYDVGENSCSVLSLTNDEAKTFFLKKESYCNFDLPKYIDFSSLLSGVDAFLTGKDINTMGGKNAKKHEGVNYLLLSNKDGKFAWRPFELIHPALYVALVHKITEESNWNLIVQRFNILHQNDKIQCLSMPVESLTDEKDKAAQITQWWHSVEQKSIELALEFDYLFETDLTDCYGSIYTHSIPWALHDKAVAKQDHSHNLLGNVIDSLIQSMRFSQTNGIPQGSVLMDFIAEMVLGYADSLIAEKLEEIDPDMVYQILRYRDDFKIFVNNPQIGELVLKTMTEVMSGLGLKMNPSKTKSTSQVIKGSIKEDKVEWLKRKPTASSLQKRLLLIHDHATNYPNAGSLAKALSDFNKSLTKVEELQPNSIMPMISITADIALHNPRHLPACAAILSDFICRIESESEKTAVIDRIQKKFERVPNTGFLDIWLQRITLPFEPTKFYNEEICKVVNQTTSDLWNSDWITSTKLKTAVDPLCTVDQDEIEALTCTIEADEFELFFDEWES
jgi:hypothetical protein